MIFWALCHQRIVVQTRLLVKNAWVELVAPRAKTAIVATREQLPNADL